ncbi:MAG: biotin--[acetyl-CoA-carboxylase] ligase [Bifidobacteriaceae bacterium]|jgi:BirA family biotin operon repressor/biotin-[acetyl-CoA-carboxylase] ligase|nr:biotin--[acetyl-CoA-carboxylase] ligase [Bifidobacteriaceae bacterium]
MTQVSTLGSVQAPLDSARLTEALVAQGPYAQVNVVSEVGSTNSELIREAGQRPHLTALLAEFQTQGRGRRHLGEATPRAWLAPPRSSLLASVLVRPPAAGAPTTLLGLAFGLAAVRSLDLVAPGSGLKWPNDIVLGGRKIGGLLAQVASGGAVVIGLGLNVSQTASQLPAPAAPGAPRPGSLALLGAVGVDRTWLAIAYLAAAAGLCERWARGEADLLDGIGQRMTTLGRDVLVELPSAETLSGRAAGLDRDGALVIRAGGGCSTRVVAGEVRLAPPADGREGRLDD